MSVDVNRARQEYELARASAWLAAFISAAIIASNFGPAPREIGEAQEQVLIHRKILREHEQLLGQNEAVLRENQALMAARRAVSPSSK